MSNKVSTGFAAYSDADLEAKTQFIIQNMTGNAVFPTPVLTLESVQAALIDFQAAVTALQVAVWVQKMYATKRK
ncbi:MAG: hypothetical protein PW786_12630 [Arachidicoccus sp.]|nr:hypothetical protein [Arachidicoccus sp.]